MITYMIIYKTKAFIITKQFLIWGDQLSASFPVFLTSIDGFGASPGSSTVKNPPVIPDVGLMPGLGRSLGEENGNSFQYSCLRNLMD